MMRGLGLALALLLGGMQAAMAQPSANAIATVETALFCGEVAKRADDFDTFSLYRPNERRANHGDLDAIDARYVLTLDDLVQQAGYAPDKLAERQAAHRGVVSRMITDTMVLQTQLCAKPVTLQPRDTSTPPKGELQLALGGRTKTDVMYVDMKTLHRMGPVVGGWQLYVFNADQNVGGKLSKGQWMRFYVDCVSPTFVTYGAVGLDDLKSDKPYTADTRAAPSIKPVQAGTFGAVAWMLACGVTQPGATQPTLAAAADYSVGQFVQ
jgi:hypothetical protein